MSVVVKNMRMPSDCLECNFYISSREESICAAADKEIPDNKCDERSSICPLQDYVLVANKEFHWYARCDIRPKTPLSTFCCSFGETSHQFDINEDIIQSTQSHFLSWDTYHRGYKLFVHFTKDSYIELVPGMRMKGGEKLTEDMNIEDCLYKGLFNELR